MFSFVESAKVVFMAFVDLTCNFNWFLPSAQLMPTVLFDYPKEAAELVPTVVYVVGTATVHCTSSYVDPDSNWIRIQQFSKKL